VAEPTIADLQKQIEELTSRLAEQDADKLRIATGEIPRYRMIEPFYADDILWPVGAELDYDGWPNEYMEPLNEPARAKMRIILQGISKKPLAEHIEAAHRQLNQRNRQAAEPLTEALIHALSRLGVGGPALAAATADMPVPIEAAAPEPPMPEMPKADKSIPIRGDLALPGQRKRGRPRKVLASKLPEETGKPIGPERVFGTIVTENRGAIVTGGGLS
jgi:hypothetical protein